MYERENGKIGIDERALEIAENLGSRANPGNFKVIEKEVLVEPPEIKSYKEMSRRQVILTILDTLWPKIKNKNASTGEVQTFVKLYDEVYAKKKRVEEEPDFDDDLLEKYKDAI